MREEALNLPRWQCHKVVRAAKITAVEYTWSEGEAYGGGGATLHFGDESRIEVDDNYLAKHDPTDGGYYVVYDDGYESFSPAEAFEKGYTRVEEDKVP